MCDSARATDRDPRISIACAACRIEVETTDTRRYSARRMAMRGGATVHGFRLEERVGSGGFAEVWSARAPDGGRVALKLLRPPPPESARARLEVEARAHALVRHPGICALVSILPDRDGLAFELLTGPSLAERTEEEPLGLSAAARAMLPILAALDACHAAGMVHRDVTPSNILLDADRGAKLIDFGVARIQETRGSTVSVTTSDAALGTLVHQAPEQIDDPRRVDGRADLYGAGSSLFTVLAGRAPFRAPSAAALLTLKATRNAPSLREVTGRSWPDEVESVLARLLARDPQERFSSGREVAARLARVAEKESTCAT